VERFLQLCAEDNIQVANCTTPAQFFHLLRRQMRWQFRTPLVVLTPKSLLRAPKATSQVAEFSTGGFFKVIGDSAAERNHDAVRRVLICSGKIYYELLAALEKHVEGGQRNVALVRVEQLYPWPDVALAEVVRRYENAETVFWVQEEPANMGAWTFVRGRLPDVLRPNQKVAYAGRAEHASPAGGSLRVHRERQARLIAAAFAGIE